MNVVVFFGFSVFLNRNTPLGTVGVEGVNSKAMVKQKLIMIKLNKKFTRTCIGYLPACSYKPIALFQSALHLVRLSFVLGCQKIESINPDMKTKASCLQKNSQTWSKKTKTFFTLEFFDTSAYH